MIAIFHRIKVFCMICPPVLLFSVHCNYLCRIMLLKLCLWISINNFLLCYPLFIWMFFEYIWTDYLVDEGTECNSTSDLLLERNREQSLVDLLVPSLVLLINLLQKLLVSCHFIWTILMRLYLSSSCSSKLNHWSCSKFFLAWIWDVCLISSFRMWYDMVPVLIIFTTLSK